MEKSVQDGIMRPATKVIRLCRTKVLVTVDTFKASCDNATEVGVILTPLLIKKRGAIHPLKKWGNVEIWKTKERLPHFNITTFFNSPCMHLCFYTYCFS